MSLLRHRATRIVLDTGLLVGFIAEFLTREGPDYDLHSWIGIVLIPIVGVHLAGNWRWITSTIKRTTAHPEWKLARFNAVFAVVTLVCIVSGFPLWLEWTEGGTVSGLHNITGFVSVVMSLSHLWRNRSRVMALARPRPAAA